MVLKVGGFTMESLGGWTLGVFLRPLVQVYSETRHFWG